MGIRTLSKAGYEAWRNWGKAKPRERSEYQEERRLDKVMAEVEALGIHNDEARELFEYRKRGYELEPVNLDKAA